MGIIYCGRKYASGCGNRYEIDAQDWVLTMTAAVDSLLFFWVGVGGKQLSVSTSVRHTNTPIIPVRKRGKVNSKFVTLCLDPVKKLC